MYVVLYVKLVKIVQHYWNIYQLYKICLFIVTYCKTLLYHISCFPEVCLAVKSDMDREIQYWLNWMFE